MAELGDPTQQQLPSEGEPPRPFASPQQLPVARENIGQVGVEAARAASEFWTRHQYEMNAAHLAEGQAKLISLRADALDNPDSGFKTQKGLAARDAIPVYRDQLQEAYGQLVQSAPNNAVRRGIAMHAALQMSDFEREASSHALDQEQQYKTAAFNEAVRVGENDVLSSWANPAEAENRLRRMAPLVHEEAKRLGDPDDTAGRYRQLQQRTLVKVMDELLAHNEIKKAEELLGQHRTDLGTEAPRLDGELEHRRNATLALNDGLDLVAKFRTNKFGVVDEGKAEDELTKRVKAGENITPERFEQTMTIVRGRNAAGREAENVATSTAFQAVMGVWQKAGQGARGDAAVARSPEAQVAMQVLLDPTNESGAERLVAFQRQTRSEERYERSLGRQEAADVWREVTDAKREQREHDRDALDRFHALDDAREQSTMEVSEKNFPGVSEDGINRIKAAQNALKKQLDKGFGEARDGFRNEITIHELQAGLTNKSDQKRFQSYMLQQYDSWHTAHEGKKPEREDVDKLFLDGLEKVDVPGTLWGTNRVERWKAATSSKPAVAAAATAATSSAPAAAASPRAAPAAGPLRAGYQAPAPERRQLPDGRVLEKGADGTVRVVGP